MAATKVTINIESLLGKYLPGYAKSTLLPRWTDLQEKSILDSTEDEKCAICSKEHPAGLRCGICFDCAIEKGVIHECLEGTFNVDDPRIKSAGGAKGAKQEGTVIQSLVFEKGVFSEAEAKQWAKDHNFRADKVDSKKGEFRLRQQSPGDFDPNGFAPGEKFRTITITKGLQATIGFLSKAEAEKIASGVKAALGAAMGALGAPESREAGASGTSEAGKGSDTGDSDTRDPGAKSAGQEIIDGLMEAVAGVGLKTTEVREIKAQYEIFKVDQDRRLVFGPAMVPDKVDTQGDFELSEDIEEAAHKFIAEHRGIDDMHMVFDGIGVPVESFILREDTVAGKNEDGSDRILPKGTWMLGVKVTNDDTWLRVKSGELTGFSIVFRGEREAVHA